MVDALHEAGIEVLLDVVFNHTAEGGHDGPTLSWRGIDNLAYYRLDAADPSRYVNWSGCGNTLDTSAPPGRRLVLDCLRYWVEAMGVDGFRFDLAPSLGRDRQGRFATTGSLLEAIAADPALAGVKLIAEPWDLGPDGYRLGSFPEPWREWNDRYRDAVRSFWRGDRGRKLGPGRGSRRQPAAVRRISTATGVGRLRHLPRRLHADRSGQLRAQAQRGQSASRTATAATATRAATGASRARPTARRSAACATGCAAA